MNAAQQDEDEAPKTAGQGKKQGKQKKPETPQRLPRAVFEYTTFLSKFPMPGGGGAHAGLFRIGAVGYKAGILEEDIIRDVTAKLDEYVASGKGGRIVSRQEVEQGVGAGFTRALEESTGMTRAKPKRRQAPAVPAGTFKKIAAARAGVTAEEIMAKSPVPLDFPEWEAGWRLVDALYAPDDLLYIGEFKGYACPGRNILKASDWVTRLKAGPPEMPFIIPNPLTGEKAPTADQAGETYRGDGNVKLFRHAVAEMDSESLEDQLAFWSWAALPVRALIMSGGKSIHAWIDVQCANVLEWELEVEEKLFPLYLFPLGCDPQCRNESRVSRLPGHTRGPGEKNPGAMQKLIWLSPEGKAVCEV